MHLISGIAEGKPGEQVAVMLEHDTVRLHQAKEARGWTRSLKITEIVILGLSKPQENRSLLSRLRAFILPPTSRIAVKTSALFADPIVLEGSIHEVLDLASEIAKARARQMGRRHVPIFA